MLLSTNRVATKTARVASFLTAMVYFLKIMTAFGVTADIQLVPTGTAGSSLFEQRKD